jgi:hypothetical protein
MSELEALRSAVLDLTRRLAEAEPILKKEFHFSLEELRDFMVERSPMLHADASALSNVLRELVQIESDKHGYGRKRGAIDLYQNLAKRHAGDPDLIGQGHVAGRVYSAAVWMDNPKKLRVSLIQHGSKHH